MTSIVKQTWRESTDNARRLIDSINTNQKLKNDEEFQEAGGAIKRLKELHTELGNTLDELKEVPVVQEYEVFKKAITTLRSVLQKEKIPGLSNMMFRYERAKKEMERLMQEEANRKAEEERLRLLREAEARKAKAAEHEEKGKEYFANLQQSKAEQLEAQAMDVTAPTITPINPPKVEKLSVKGLFKARVVSFRDLVQFCVKTNSYHLLLPNEKTLNAEAKSRDGQNPMDGVEFYEVASTTYRRD
jgi:hypothetical protein